VNLLATWRLLVAAVLIGLSFAGALGAQRCGDHLLLSFESAAGTPIAPSSFASVEMSTSNIVDNIPGVYRAAVTTGDVAGIGRRLEIRTGCGLRWVRFDVVLGKDVMQVTLHNVPGDSGNILLDGLEFTPGRFEYDLGWDTLNAALVIDHPALAAPDGLEGPRYTLRHPTLRRADAP
jgi:hypothetical protein